MKISFRILIVILLFVSCQKDDLDTGLTVLKADRIAINDPAVYEKLRTVRAYKFRNYNEINLGNHMRLQIRLGNEYKWDLSLTENVGLTQNSRSYYTTDEGVFEIESTAKHYKGQLIGFSDSDVRISFFGHKMVGYIADGKEWVEITHLHYFSDLEKYENVIVVCKPGDIITDNEQM